jgi:uncharacterized protein YhaN
MESHHFNISQTDVININRELIQNSTKLDNLILKLDDTIKQMREDSSALEQRICVVEKSNERIATKLSIIAVGCSAITSSLIAYVIKIVAN